MLEQRRGKSNYTKPTIQKPSQRWICGYLFSPLNSSLLLWYRTFCQILSGIFALLSQECEEDFGDSELESNPCNYPFLASVLNTKDRRIEFCVFFSFIHIGFQASLTYERSKSCNISLFPSTEFDYFCWSRLKKWSSLVVPFVRLTVWEIKSWEMKPLFNEKAISKSSLKRPLLSLATVTKEKRGSCTIFLIYCCTVSLWVSRPFIDKTDTMESSLQTPQANPIIFFKASLYVAGFTLPSSSFIMAEANFTALKHTHWRPSI